jgi:hypothetical protein
LTSWAASSTGEAVPLPRQSRNSTGSAAGEGQNRSRTTVFILSFRVSQGGDLRRPVVDSVADGTLAA